MAVCALAFTPHTHAFVAQRLLHAGMSQQTDEDVRKASIFTNLVSELNTGCQESSLYIFLLLVLLLLSHIPPRPRPRWFIYHVVDYYLYSC